MGGQPVSAAANSVGLDALMRARLISLMPIFELQFPAEKIEAGVYRLRRSCLARSRCAGADCGLINRIETPQEPQQVGVTHRDASRLLEMVRDVFGLLSVESAVEVAGVFYAAGRRSQPD